MPASARLPGIQFEVVAPPVAGALPRMDIPAFVGFASSGPLHEPVAVEDIARFQEIFGSDLALARLGGRGQPQYAYLAPAVRAFFRNGGRRCWVVRVAGPGATANLFPIPGLFALGPAGPQPAFAPARSEGSWSSDLTVGASLRSHAIQATGFSLNSVNLTLITPGEVAPGDLLKLTFRDTAGVLWLFADAVTGAPGSSPPHARAAGQPVTVSATQHYWQPAASPPSFPPDPAAGHLPVCERVSLDLFVQGPGGQTWSLTDLGFAPAHPRYWASLPSDNDLYASDSVGGFWAEAAHPRFPLAGWQAGKFFLPLGVGILPSEFLGAISSPATALERDGLATLDSSLFLDRALEEILAGDLLAEADYIRYQSPAPRKLVGIHAALAIEEASLLVVPDAVQIGWFRIYPAPLASPPLSSPLQHPEWWHSLDCSQKHDLPRTPQPPAGEFLPCDLKIVAAPHLSLSAIEGGRFSLTWPALPGATDFLEEAGDPAFASAVVIYRGSSGHVTVYSRPEGDYYYRVRREEFGVSSDYSNPVALRVEPEIDWQVLSSSAYSSKLLLDVHRAALRLCAGRGDLFAVLALPEHYRERDALAHAAQLKSAHDESSLVPAIGLGEAQVFSYGALYHPWLTGREENDLDNLRSNPPDGAAAGVLALRSAERGAWIAPANEPLRGVVALTPALSRAYLQAFQDAGINTIRQEPRGFLCLSELTLSDDPDVQPVNVRRLMSLLRKTVLRVGADYVFEPNSDKFRRAVERGFEKMLDFMFLQGAFAGRTSREAFQVVTDNGLNDASAMDNGRFFVEIKVAPSLPLRFLTVRLLQTADRTFVTEGK